MLPKHQLNFVLRTRLSTFRQQTNLVGNSVCQMRFSIMFGVRDFADAEKRLRAAVLYSSPLLARPRPSPSNHLSSPSPSHHSPSPSPSHHSPSPSPSHNSPSPILDNRAALTRPWSKSPKLHVTGPRTSPSHRLPRPRPRQRTGKVGLESYNIAEQTIHAQTCFPVHSSILKLHILSITDTRQSILALSLWATSRSENNVKLSSASSNTFERSSRSDDKQAPRIKQNSIWKHLQTTIC